jgi:hypothetical protein
LTLRPATSKGLNKKRITSSGAGKFVRFTDDNPVNTIQFFTDPDEFLEYEKHTFRDDGKWNYVPCAGKGVCPLCEDEEEDVSKVTYAFVTNVYNLGLKKVQLLSGPKTMAERIFLRYERKPSTFTKRVFDVTRIPGQFVQYDFDIAEERPVRLGDKTQYDLQEALAENMRAYYGDDVDIAVSDLRRDDEDDYDDVDDVDDEAEDDDVDGVDDEYEDDDDLDELDDDLDELDDDDDDEEEVATTSRRPAPKPTKRGRKPAPKGARARS